MKWRKQNYRAISHVLSFLEVWNGKTEKFVWYLITAREKKMANWMVLYEAFTAIIQHPTPIRILQRKKKIYLLVSNGSTGIICIFLWYWNATKKKKKITKQSKWIQLKNGKWECGSKSRVNNRNRKINPITQREWHWR